MSIMTPYSQVRTIFHGAPYYFSYFDFDRASDWGDFGARLYAFPDEFSAREFVRSNATEAQVVLQTSLAVDLQLDYWGESIQNGVSVLVLDPENNDEHLQQWVLTVTAHSLPNMYNDFIAAYPQITECLRHDIIYAPRADSRKHQLIPYEIQDDITKLMHFTECEKLYYLLSPEHFTPQLIFTQDGAKALLTEPWQEI